MARRRSAIAKRLTKMRGITQEEKNLLVNIGELVDAAVNNRTPTNPFERDIRLRTDPRLPPPRSVTVNPGIRSTVLRWDAVNASILLRYELRITNRDTGVTEDFFSPTNTFNFKGRIGGNYRATIRSVGRNGTASPLTQFDFSVADDLMLIEGAKNNVDSVSTFVNENLVQIKGHIIHVWGSFVIDKVIAPPLAGNSVAVMRLLKGPPDSQIDDEGIEVIEERTIFAASETAANLDDNALGGSGIGRPEFTGSALGDPNKLRGTTFETSFAELFSYEVLDADVGQPLEFFIQVTNRETENDVVGLSMALWSAAEASAANIPGDPFEPEPPIVDFWDRSVELDGNDQYMRGEISESFRVTGNRWTFGIWIKPLANFIDGAIIFDRLALAPAPGPVGFRRNRIQIGTLTVVGPNPDMQILIGDNAGVQELFRTRRNITAPAAGADDPGNPILPVGDWTLLWVSYNPAGGIRVFTNGGASSFSAVTNTTPLAGVMTDEENMAYIIGAAALSVYDTTGGAGGVWNGASDAATGEINARIHAAGIWNRELLGAERLELFNNPGKSWLINAGDYTGANNLVHYWQFGAIETPIGQVGRDTGVNVFNGDVDMTDSGEIPNDLENDFPDFIVNDAPS